MTEGSSYRTLFPWTDLARFVAACLVVISHVRDVLMVDYGGARWSAPFYAVTGLGHSAVIVFFVLSGFWISRSVLRRMDQPTFWQDYTVDRLSRLWIVLLPALALGGLLDWAGSEALNLPLYWQQGGRHSLDVPVALHLSPMVLLGNMLFLQTIVVHVLGSNGPLWSLASEFWYYIWFPALALLVLRRKVNPALAGLAVALLAPTITLGFLSWLAGLALFLALQRAEDRPTMPRALSLAGLVLFGVILLGSRGLHGSWMDPVLGVSFALALYLLARAKVAMPGWLELPARYGARASFSLYAVHFPMLAFVGGWLTRSGRFTTGPMGVMLVLAVTAGLLAAGWLFSLVTERHTDRLRQALRRPQPVNA